MELRSGTPHDSEWVAPVGSFMSWSIRPETRRGGEIVTGTVMGSQSDVCAASLGQGSMKLVVGRRQLNSHHQNEAAQSLS